MSCFRMQRAFVFGLAFFVWATLPIFHVGIDVRAQQSNAAALASDEREKAIKLYTAGETKKAVEALRAVVKKRKDDADAWYYLGLALNRNADAKNARKAFETSVKLRPDFAVAHVGLAYTLLLANKLSEAESEAQRALSLNACEFTAHYIIGMVRLREDAPQKALEEAEAALKIQNNFSSALLLKCQSLISLYADETAFLKKDSSEKRAVRLSKADARLKEASESLEEFIKLSPNAADIEAQREQLSALRFYAKLSDKPENGRSVFHLSEIKNEAPFSKYPEALYTEAAQQALVKGTVRLLVTLSTDGKVQNILVLKSLGYGLTESAINAARKIKFVPAVMDGRRVSVVATLEYNFGYY